MSVCPHPQPLPKALGRGENGLLKPFPVATGKGLGWGQPSAEFGISRWCQNEKPAHENHPHPAFALHFLPDGDPIPHHTQNPTRLTVNYNYPPYQIAAFDKRTTFHNTHV